MDNLYAQKKVENGQVLLPQMYGDPRGYKYDGPPSWYHYTNKLYTDRSGGDLLLVDGPQGSGAGPDRGKIRWTAVDAATATVRRIAPRPWLGFLEGKLPDFPEKALQADLARVRRRMEMIRNDETSADTRLADYLLDFNPGNHQWPGQPHPGRILFARAHLDAAQPLPLLRPGQAARRTAARTSARWLRNWAPTRPVMTLVNTNPIDAREVVVQAGGYGEHRFDSVTMAGQTIQVAGPVFTRPARARRRRASRFQDDPLRKPSDLRLARGIAAGTRGHRFKSRTASSSLELGQTIAAPVLKGQTVGAKSPIFRYHFCR